ncbi:hypothetical protein GCM10009596_08680 [Arthrobacter rhombi]
MTRRLPLRWGIVGLLMASLLSGCSLSPNASLPAPDGAGAGVGTPAPIDAGDAADGETNERLLAGVDRASRSDEQRNIHASWYTLPGEPEFGQSQERALQGTIDHYVDDLSPQAFDGVAPPELNTSSTLTGSSDRMLGVRQSTYTFLGASGGSSYRTLWYDREDRKTLAPRDLFDSDKDWERFRSLTSEQLAADDDVFPEEAASPAAALFDSVNFDARGNALVEFDDYSVAPGSVSPVIATIAAEDLLPLLSQRGLAVRAAGMEPAPVTSTPQDDGSGDGTGREGASPTPRAAGQPTTRTSPDCRKVKCIALSFDDGPGPSTGRLLSMLADHDARATFFVVGPNAQRYPEVLKQAADAGHEIGNHTWSHRSLPGLAPEQAREELGRTDDAVAAATGSTPTLTRPPYGATNREVNRLVHTPVILWDVDTLDWKHRDADIVARSALRDAHPGAIMLMHDIHPTSVDAMPRILDRLAAQGYHFVTVSELLESSNPKAQVAYSHGPTGK